MKKRLLVIKYPIKNLCDDLSKSISHMIFVISATLLFLMPGVASAACTGYLSVKHNGQVATVSRVTSVSEIWTKNCLDTHYNQRWDYVGSEDPSILPTVCKLPYVAGNSKFEVDIKKQIEVIACNKFTEQVVKNGAINVEVIRSVSGSGCGGSKNHGTYQISKAMCL